MRIRFDPVIATGERFHGMSGKNIVNDAIIKDLSDKIHGIEDGTVIVSIYNSRIVQIDITKTEKRRFDEVWILENGEGI